MIFIKQKTSNVYVKAKAENEPYKYKKGDTIWTNRYSYDEHRYIRIPTWIVVRVYKNQNLILKPYYATDYVAKFMN